MAYSVNTNILALLPNMPQTSTDAGYLQVSSMVDSHIARADNVINGKIARRYNVGSFNTTTATPPLLRTLSEDMTSYFVFRSEFSGDNQRQNEWTDKFKDALSILDELRDGKIDLCDSTGSIIDERQTSSIDYIDSSHEDYQSFFDIDSELNWKFDSELSNEVNGKR